MAPTVNDPQVLLKGCVNLPERTGTDLITGTDPFSVGFCNIYIKFPIIL